MHFIAFLITVWVLAKVGILSTKFIRRTALEPTTKLSYEAVQPRF